MTRRLDSRANQQGKMKRWWAHPGRDKYDSLYRASCSAIRFGCSLNIPTVNAVPFLRQLLSASQNKLLWAFVSASLPLCIDLSFYLDFMLAEIILQVKMIPISFHLEHPYSPHSAKSSLLLRPLVPPVRVLHLGAPPDFQSLYLLFQSKCKCNTSTTGQLPNSQTMGPSNTILLGFTISLSALVQPITGFKHSSRTCCQQETEHCVTCILMVPCSRSPDHHSQRLHIDVKQYRGQGITLWDLSTQMP